MTDMLYHNEINDATDDLVGSPVLDAPIAVTCFPKMSAGSKKTLRLPLRQLAAEIEATTADTKEALPWFKLAKFGTARTKKGSLRSDDNMLLATGCELDFDDCRYTPLQARHRLRTAGLGFLIYTTPQHQWEGRGNRFRVLLPFSGALPPEERSRMVARVNGLLGGLADPASFTMSQSFYGGNVSGRPKIKTWLVDGDFVDRRDDLDATARGKRGREKGVANDNSADEAALLEAISSGENYHGSAISLAGKWAAAGISYVDALARLQAAFMLVPDDQRDSRWRARVKALPDVLGHVYDKQLVEDYAEHERRNAVFDDEAEIDALLDELVGNPAKVDSDIQADIDELVGKPFFASAASWAGQEVPPRDWLIHGLIPSKTVTMLGGDGGTGKSLLALQLACSVAMGERWIGRNVERPGKVLFLSAEDDQDELHRRLHDICRSMGVDMEDLDRLMIRSLAGENALLATLNRKTNSLRKTPLYDLIDKAMTAAKPSLIVLDTLSDLHAGEENSRAHARQFIGMLRNLAIRHDCAVLLLAHPSLTGMSNGSGLSGSTAWNNSVRSRLYLDRIKDDDGSEANPDARVLRTMKANYSATGGEIGLNWAEGVFHHDIQDFDEQPKEKAERVFLKLLDTFHAQKRHVSHSVSSTYAPSQFEAHPEAERCTKGQFKRAMDQLLANGVITVAEHGRPGKERQHLERASE